MLFSRKLYKTALLSVSIVVSVLFFAKYGKESGVFYGDSLGYYLYLTSGFIYHNHTSVDQLPANKDIAWPVRVYMNTMKKEGLRTSKGYIINQYTYGVALLELPFFLIAHAYEKLSGLPANGFSPTYNYLVKISGFVYSLFGFLLIFKILKRYFNEVQSLTAIVLIFLGTHFFWFAVNQAGMSHIPLFFLYALLMYLTIKVHEHPKAIIFIAVGLVIGLITIIRPTDILCLLIPLLYNVYNRKTLADKYRFIRGNYRNVGLAAVAFIIPLIPQMLYWKMMTGSFIFYSYGQQSFDWLHPKIMEGVFHFNNGWLPYAPAMMFAIAGLFMYKSIKVWAWCIWIILPVYVYVIYSWYCYNYINGLGSRPMIHMYPLLAIPLAAFIKYIADRKFAVKFVFVVACLFFASMNISYCVQKADGKLNSEESNFLYNWNLMFRYKLGYNDLLYNDDLPLQPDTSKITKLYTLACNNYEDSTSWHYEDDTSKNGSKYVYYMSGDQDYNEKSFKVIYDAAKFGDAKWIKCSGDFMCTEQTDYNKHLLVLGINHNGASLLWKAAKIENKIGVADGKCRHEIRLDHGELNKWGYIYYYIRIPKNISNGDVIEMIVWNVAKKDLYMDNLCLELYK